MVKTFLLVVIILDGRKNKNNNNNNNNNVAQLLQHHIRFWYVKNREKAQMGRPVWSQQDDFECALSKIKY